MKGVHPLVDQPFGYPALLLDFAGISTEFSGPITTQFCFSYLLGGVTACHVGYTIGSATHFVFCLTFSWH